MCCTFEESILSRKDRYHGDEKTTNLPISEVQFLTSRCSVIGKFTPFDVTSLLVQLSAERQKIFVLTDETTCKLLNSYRGVDLIEPECVSMRVSCGAICMGSRVPSTFVRTNGREPRDDGIGRHPRARLTNVGDAVVAVSRHPPKGSKFDRGGLGRGTLPPAWL